MNPEERETLRRVALLAEENNVLIKKMRRNAHISVAFRAAYWIIFLGVSFGAYYFIQPYVERIMPILNTAITEINSASSTR
jgi:hypothetical protein